MYRSNIMSQGGGFTDMFRNMSWTTISLIVLVIIVLIIFILYYFNVFSNSTKTSYKPNLEGGQGPSNKQVEIILFYTDWCPHCKTAKPEWEDMKAEYEGKNINGYNLVFTEYNCTNETAEIEELMNKYSIEGYPTIKLIKDNQVIEYDAKPTKDTMEQFLNTVL